MSGGGPETMRVGVWLPTRGAPSSVPGIAVMAGNAEAAGFDLLIIPDHVVMRTETKSWFPFTRDGIPVWDPRTPWHDAVVSLAICAAVTERIEIGTGVLVLPLREPVVLAKQLASIDVASGGRVFLGVGAGWFAEEYEALGVPFTTRGARMDEWITLLRALCRPLCPWTPACASGLRRPSRRWPVPGRATRRTPAPRPFTSPMSR